MNAPHTHDDDEGDAMLMALADGELNPGDAAPLLARVAANPALAERFALFVSTRAMTRAAYDAGPVPDRLIEAILAAPAQPAAASPVAPADSVVPFRPRPRFIAAGGLALAASLVLAVGLGTVLGGRPGPAEDPALRAAQVTAGLATGETADIGAGTARVTGSYATAAGLCRTLSIEGADGRREQAVVCRNGADGWTVALSVALGGTSDFVTASDSVTAAIDGYLDSIGAGSALGPEEEAAALR